jgi:general secretion pathway protein D
MSSNKSDGNAGIPLLKDIPGLGQLFRSNTGQSDRTELIVLITPYIIEDDSDAQTVTDAFRKQLGAWAQPAAVAPRPPALAPAAQGQ